MSDFNKVYQQKIPKMFIFKYVQFVLNINNHMYAENDMIAWNVWR